MNYFFFIAEEVRQIMAQLGIRKFDDTDRPHRPARHAQRYRALEGVRPGLQPPVRPAQRTRRCMPRFHVDVQDHNIEHTLDRKLIERSQPAIQRASACSSSRWRAA